MSRARRLRRQADRDAERQLRQAIASPTTVITAGANGNATPDSLYDTVTKANGDTFTVARIPDNAPAELKAALTRRRQSALTGRCPCGAKRRRSTAHAAGIVVYMAPVPHRPECPASDANLVALAHRLGWQPE